MFIKFLDFSLVFLFYKALLEVSVRFQTQKVTSPVESKFYTKMRFEPTLLIRLRNLSMNKYPGVE